MNALLRLVRIIAPAWPALLAACLLAVATVAANVGLMATAAYLIAAAALHPPLAALAPAVTGVRFFGLARAVCRYLERYMAHDATFRLLGRLRVWLYGALEPLVPARSAAFRGGELWSRFVNDVDTLQYFYLHVLLPPAAALAVLAGMALALRGFGAGFALLLATGFFCAGVLLPAALYRLAKDDAGKLPAARAGLAVTLADSVTGLRDLLIFGQAGRQAARVAAADRRYGRLQGRTAGLAGTAGAGGSLVMNAVLLGTVLLAVPLVNNGQLDGVYLAALALGVQNSFEAVLPLTGAYRYWQESAAAAGRLFAVLDAAPATPAAEQADRAPASLDLEVDNVKFRYRDGLPWALDGVSFRLPVGGRLAIVGPSGAGKSTLAALLLRFWDYDGGRICLGGEEISNFRPEALRNLIGVVPQDSHIFAATLGDNIRLARPEAAPADVAAAAGRAALGGLLAALPQGLETPVGENGHGLSGGERRRLALARVLLKDPPLVILDEPLAGVDPVTAGEIIATLRETLAGKTAILITHRLIGLDDMDEILVLDRGRVADRGRQEELLARQGLFYDLWRLQNDLFAGERPA